MPQLVAEDGEDLVVRHLVEEGVEEHDAFVLSEAEHEGVAVAAALGAIDDKELRQRVLDPATSEASRERRWNRRS